MFGVEAHANSCPGDTVDMVDDLDVIRSESQMWSRGYVSIKKIWMIYLLYVEVAKMERI